MSFFRDCLSGFNYGNVYVKTETWGVDSAGRPAITSTNTTRLKSIKSIQPIQNEEDIQMFGFGDFSINEYFFIYSLKELPFPTNGVTISLTFNKQTYKPLRQIPFVWDRGTKKELGYYKTLVMRIGEGLGI